MEKRRKNKRPQLMISRLVAANNKTYDEEVLLQLYEITFKLVIKRVNMSQDEGFEVWTLCSVRKKKIDATKIVCAVCVYFATVVYFYISSLVWKTSWGFWNVAKPFWLIFGSTSVGLCICERFWKTGFWWFTTEVFYSIEIK